VLHYLFSRTLFSSKLSFIRPFIKQFIETFTFSRQTLTFLAIYRIYDHFISEPYFAGNLTNLQYLPANRAIFNSDPLKGERKRLVTYTYVIKTMTKALQGGV